MKEITAGALLFKMTVGGIVLSATTLTGSLSYHLYTTSPNRAAESGIHAAAMESQADAGSLTVAEDLGSLLASQSTGQSVSGHFGAVGDRSIAAVDHPAVSGGDSNHGPDPSAKAPAAANGINPLGAGENTDAPGADPSGVGSGTGAVGTDDQNSPPGTDNAVNPNPFGADGNSGTDVSGADGATGSGPSAPTDVANPSGTASAFSNPGTHAGVPAYINATKTLGDIADLNAAASIYEENMSRYMAILDTAMGPMIYYNQGDERWGNYLYGGADPMRKYGCGPTAVAMIVSSFTSQGTNYTPVNMANWAAANGGYAPQGGSYHSMIPKSLSSFGLDVEGVELYSEETASDLLRSGHVLVALMGQGALTNNGHFIIITKILDNGNVYIADPNSFKNSTKEWNLAQLMNELKGSYDSGGPLWAVQYK